MIIDGHRHIGFAGSRGHCPAEKVLEEMEAHQIDKTVVLPINAPPQEEEVAYGAALDKANRDFIDKGIVSDQLKQMRRHREDHSLVAQAIKVYPDRLIGIFQVNPWLGSAMLAEAETAVREQGFRGFKLHPVVNGFPADHEIVESVLMLAKELKVPVMFHASYGYGCGPWRIGKLASRFPDLDLVLYHAGLEWEQMARTEDAIRVANENANVWIDLSDAQASQVQAIIDRAPGERVVFGSDDPYGKLELQLARTLEAIGSREYLRELIMGENMRKLLALS